jgi:crotonobetainyl-CoA:carnitine CoA-transferase CaiB-like acyl-CoA transferase
LLEKWTSVAEAERLMQLLQSAGVPAGVVQNAEDLAEDPQLLARRFFLDLDHPVLGKTVLDRSPIRMEGISETEWKPAPLLGSDNRYVFRELLGMSEMEMFSSIEKGIIG